jgi:S1-C subfamily serine protease
MPEPQPSAALADAVEALAASVVGVTTKRHAAAGVLWQGGLVVTSAGAMSPGWRASRSERIEVVLPGGEPVAGTLRGADPSTDLALIGLDVGSAAGTAKPLRDEPAGQGEQAAPRAGDFVFAVGREPSGLVQASFGHVGAAGGEWRSWRGGRIERLIRLDGGLYPGLAGAAVGNAAGRFVGIASPAFSRLHGVVIPRVTLERVLPLLLAHGRVPQGYLGIAVQPVRATLDGQGVDGLLVSSVADDGPAARAGLLVGDVIVAVNGRPAPRLEALREQLVGSAGGTEGTGGRRLALKIARAGAAVTLEIEATERPARGCP